MPFLLTLLKPRSFLTWGPWALLTGLLFFTWNQHETLKTQRQELLTVRTSLANPKIVEKVVVKKVAGPVRIVTKTVERPSGEKETTVEETRGETTETAETDTKKTPVSVASLMGNLRNDRWLVGADLRNFSPKDFNAYTVYGGYSVNNRVDVMAGLGKRDRAEFHLLVVGRF